MDYQLIVLPTCILRIKNLIISYHINSNKILNLLDILFFTLVKAFIQILNILIYIYETWTYNLLKEIG